VGLAGHGISRPPRPTSQMLDVDPISGEACMVVHGMEADTIF
jgi:hypothetical protein